MNSRSDAKPAVTARVLGIDYGSKRIGVAVSDEKRQFALPLTVVQNTPDLAEKIATIALGHEAGEIVLGESRNYKGEPNLILLESIDFKKKLEERGFVVHFEQEFMTSAQAERLQGKNDKTDASAAALILQSHLDRMNSEK
ncbi:MAG: putative pre6S rRNA nuclease [Candidatus Parcubacteria bacterium]|jgi:putative Holliday junction resolvase|nr:putative pre6S rRNA nuclease [Candidatus Parcubacteria bacterium]